MDSSIFNPYTKDSEVRFVKLAVVNISITRNCDTCLAFVCNNTKIPHETKGNTYTFRFIHWCHGSDYVQHKTTDKERNRHTYFAFDPLDRSHQCCPFAWPQKCNSNKGTNTTNIKNNTHQKNNKQERTNNGHTLPHPVHPNFTMAHSSHICAYHRYSVALHF